MRGRLCLVGAGLALLTGCGGEETVTRSSLPPPTLVQLPAASAGGACELLDYPMIEQLTGNRFDVAAASRHVKTSTCVVRAEAARRPSLALSVTPTSADVSVFKAEMVPRGSRTVKDLGKTAYQLVVAPAKGDGPGVEVGWLTGDGRAVSLRYTLPADQDRAAAEAFGGKLLDLAKKIDSASR